MEYYTALKRQHPTSTCNTDKPQKHFAEFKKKHSGKDKTQRKLGKWLPRPGAGAVIGYEGSFV